MQVGGGPYGVVLNDLDPGTQGPGYRYEHYGRYGEPEAAGRASGDQRASGSA